VNFSPGFARRDSAHSGFYTNLHSCGDRGGSEEPTQAYYKYVEESDVATTKVYT